MRGTLLARSVLTGPGRIAVLARAARNWAGRRQIRTARTAIRPSRRSSTASHRMSGLQRQTLAADLVTKHALGPGRAARGRAYLLRCWRIGLRAGRGRHRDQARRGRHGVVRHSRRPWSPCSRGASGRRGSVRGCTCRGARTTWVCTAATECDQSAQSKRQNKKPLHGSYLTFLRYEHHGETVGQATLQHRA